MVVKSGPNLNKTFKPCTFAIVYHSICPISIPQWWLYSRIVGPFLDLMVRKFKLFVAPLTVFFFLHHYCWKIALVTGGNSMKNMANRNIVDRHKRRQDTYIHTASQIVSIRQAPFFIKFKRNFMYIFLHTMKAVTFPPICTKRKANVLR